MDDELEEERHDGEDGGDAQAQRAAMVVAMRLKLVEAMIKMQRQSGGRPEIQMPRSRHGRSRKHWRDLCELS